MNNETKLEREDLNKIVSIIERTGGSLPDLYYLAQSILTFISRVSKIFSYEV